MAIGSPQWMYKSGEAYEIEQSLKFNDNDTAYLSKTFATAGNQKTFTWSGWVKLNNTTDRAFFGATGGSSAIKTKGSKIQFEQYGSGTNYYIKTSAVLRDFSAWYHIVAVWDSSNSTSSDRIRLYINGERATDLAGSDYPALNYDHEINSASEHRVGHDLSGARYMDGYMAEVNFIDGTALTPSSFGETGTYGEWKPKEYSGTYGTNGFYLPFKQDYTVEGFSAVTWKGDSVDGKYFGGVGFNPDLIWTKARSVGYSGSLYDSVRGYGSVHNLVTSTTEAENGGNHVYGGIASSSADGFTTFVGTDGGNPYANHNESGKTYVAWNWDMGGTAKTVTAANGTVHSTTQKKMGSTGIRYDGNNELSTSHHDDFTFGTSDFTIEMWFYVDSSSHEKPLMSKGYYTLGVNGGWMARVDEWTSRHLTFSYHDSRGNAQQYLSAANVFNRNAWNHVAFVRRYGTDFKAYLNGTAVADTRSDDLANTDFLANNKDLMIGHETTYQSGNNAHFWGYLDEIRVSKTARYTANFTPSTTYFDGDSNTTLLIHSNEANNDTSFVDSSSVEYNSDGSINSFVQANPTYGQSIVSYTGNATAGATVGHGLSSAPEMMIIKNRDQAVDWIAWHEALADDYHLRFHDTHAALNSSTRFNSTDPSSTVFTLGTQDDTNGSSKNMIAYCFHSVTGYSKIGSYTGNGLADGPTITTGFRPAFILTKNIDAADDWSIADSTRSPEIDVSTGKSLRPNSSSAEDSSADIKFTSTGFKITQADSHRINYNNETFIYMAFADKREYAYWLDQSGNNNDWTSNNLTESDISVDSPTNNFPTLNPLDDSNSTLSEGNLKTVNGSSYTGARATMAFPSSGKWYAEYAEFSTRRSNVIGSFRVVGGDTNLDDNGGSTGFYWGSSGLQVAGGGWFTGSPVDGIGSGDVLQMAYDSDTGKVWLGINNVWLRNNGGTLAADGNPAGGSNQTYTWGSSTEDTFFSIWNYSLAGVANFGQDSSFAGNKTAQGYQDGNDIGDFYYTPPTGFLALCTSNLPDATVTPSEHFNTVLYTGDGNASRTISGAGFAPDLLWGKIRSTTNNNFWFDTLRGKNRLISNSNGAETDYTTWFSTLTSDGFTTGTTNANSMNQNNATFVAWFWKANGSGSSNTNGSITSTVSANADAGFSIVSWDSNGSNATIGHGLSKAPEMIILKEREESDPWHTYHEALGNTAAVYLSTTGAADVGYSQFWNNTSPTSTVFTVSSGWTNNDADGSSIAYCFHSVDGYSKVGSYTGNGNADGTFVYTGFRPAYMLVKRTDATEDWWAIDSVRDPYNVAYHLLYPNGNNAEYSGGGPGDSNDSPYDITSNGFKNRTSNANWNASGGTYIFIAFAETPFKYSNAR